MKSNNSTAMVMIPACNALMANMSVKAGISVHYARIQLLAALALIILGIIVFIRQYIEY